MATYTPAVIYQSLDSAFPTTTTTLYTVPAATTAVVSQLVVKANFPAASLTLSFDTDAVGNRLYDAFVLPAGFPAGTVFRSVFYVIGTGKTIQGKATAGIQVFMFGYLYT